MFTVRPELRDYQQDLVQRTLQTLRAGKNPVLVLPTGAGKAVCIAAIIAYCAKHPTARILLLAHRDQLIYQLSAALTARGVPHVRLQAGGKTPGPDARVVVAMVQTATRRRMAPFDLIVVDELHHSTSASFMRLFELSPRALICGATATPLRLDGTGLGRPKLDTNRKGVFDELVIGPGMAELTEQGWLCPLRLYAPDGDTRKRFAGVEVRAGDMVMSQAAKVRLSDPVKRYRELICGNGPPLPALSFDCTVESAEATAAVFRAAGHPAAALHGGTPDSDRKQMLVALARGELHVLTSCEVLGEGVDLPAVAGALLRRPTKSLTVHLQQIGRCTRPAPGKAYATIVDFVGRFYEFGSPYASISWSLDGRLPGDGEALLKDCPGCGALIPNSARECKYCGHLFVSEVHEPFVIEDVALLEDFGAKPFESPDAATARVHRYLGDFPSDWPRGGRALRQWCQIADVLLAKNDAQAAKLCKAYGYKNGFLWFLRQQLEHRGHRYDRDTAITADG